jgi:ferredoxin-NADP reductase
MSLPKKYKAEVISVVNPIDKIYTIELKSDSGAFKYRPGQFLHLALDEYDPSSGWPESRCYSMQTSPVNEFIKITFSVKGKFTTRMADELKQGKIIDLKLPYGDFFQQDHSKENVVFIAGGTGITPFLSLFNDPSFIEYSSPKLYFGVREKGYNIYTEFLNLAMEINPGLQIDIRYQDKSGFLDLDQIFYENKEDCTYFISGPQTMISVFKSRLISLGLTGGNVKTDDWE